MAGAVLEKRARSRGLNRRLRRCPRFGAACRTGPLGRRQVAPMRACNGRHARIRLRWSVSRPVTRRRPPAVYAWIPWLLATQRGALPQQLPRRMVRLLRVRPHVERLRGTGSVDPASASGLPVEPVEVAPHPSARTTGPGLPDFVCWELAMTRKGTWRIAEGPLNCALGVAYWHAQGYRSLRERYRKRNAR